MDVASGTVTLTNDTLSSNQAQGGTGGNGGNGGNGSIVGGNGGVGGSGGAGSGGAMDVAAGSVTLTNDTLSSNQANGGTGGKGGSGGTGGKGGGFGGGGGGGNATGGGLDIASGSVTHLTNTLIAQDTLTAGSGGQAGTGGQPGSLGSATGPDVSGNVASSDHDLIGIVDGTDSNLSNGDSGGDTVGTASNPIHPLLGPLQNNGGPLAGAPGSQQVVPTMALLPGSPAIDKGDSNAPNLPALDQRGQPRIHGTAVDIGAYETQGFTLSVSGGNNQTGHPTDAFAAPLVVTVTADDGIDPVAGGQVTFTAPSSGASASLSPNPATIAANGTATVNATANPFDGSYSVTASTKGADSPVTFSLTNASPLETGLINQINAANAAGGATTITLPANTTYDFTFANNSTNGANALPVITGNITLLGNGDTLERTGTNVFRLFDVAPGGSLTLENLTLQGGLTQGTGVAAEGGAIYNSGTLSLSGVTVKSNQAVAAAFTSGNASGGGLYVAGGSVYLSADTFVGNQAQGGSGSFGFGFGSPGYQGGSGLGGGMAVASGNVTLSNDTFSGNIAQGGSGGAGGTGFLSSAGAGGTGGTGGSGLGGGLYVGGGTATLQNDTFSGNNAVGGSGGPGGFSPFATAGTGGSGGNGMGGGLDSASGTTTLANTLIARNTVTAGAAGAPGMGNSPGTPGSAGSASAPDVLGTVASSDHDLIGDGTGFSATISNGDQVGTHSSPINPQLGALQNNGGPTETMALLIVNGTPSPAIDAGDNNAAPSATDQRGYGRIVGNAIDIGAYEYGATPATTDVSISGNAPTSVTPGGQITYTLTVTNNTSTALSNVTLADVLPANTTLVSWTAPNNSWTTSAPAAGKSGTVSAWINALPANSSANFILVVQVANNTALGTVLNNTASVGPITGDPTPSDNSVSLPTTVQVAPTVSVTDPSGTYNGNPFSATGRAVGVSGQNVAGSFSYDYYVGSGTSGTNLGATAPSSAGTYTVVATFTSSDPGYTSGGTAQTTFTISPAATTTSKVSLSSSTAVYGQPVTLTATVTNTQTSVTPSGTVGFYSGATEVGTATVGANGVATLTVSTLSAGSHSLTASFSDPAVNFVPSSSPAAVTLTISKASTTTTLTATTNTPVSGQSVTFTATVAAGSPSTATPTGTVTFKDGNTVLATVSLSGGSASFTTTHLAVGNHAITVSYSGTPNFGTSSSTAYPVTVSKDATTAVVTSSVSIPVYGQSVTLKARVTALAPGSGTPSGTVTFQDGTTVLGTTTLSNGVATLTTQALSVGANAITVVYNGDSNFLGTSAALALTVNPDSTTTHLTSSSTRAAHGTPVTFTATVLPVAPGSGTPTGTVSFWDGSTLLGTVNLSNGRAQLTYVFSLPGTHRIKAVYNGDSDFLSSTSSVLTETIT
jgi:uncharacterized repeat protein (TIGR01451 family)